MKSINKTSPVREALKRISDTLKEQIKNGTLPAALADCMTVNQCLERMYRMQTGQSEWATFKGWKERGFCVQKGEKGFPLWSKPRKKGEKDEDADNADKGEQDKKPGREIFWVAYVFHAGQVADEHGNKPTGNIPANSGALLALPCNMQADIETIATGKEPEQLTLAIA